MGRDRSAMYRALGRNAGGRGYARSLKSEDVLERLGDLLLGRGVPICIGSDNGAEFTATKVREWLAGSA